MADMRGIAQDGAPPKNPTMKVNGGPVPKVPISTGSNSKPSSTGTDKK
jgi:hypothetical protein